jgi:hypothetical protein
MIGAGQAWQIASAWVAPIRRRAGEKLSLRMHDVIDRRVRAFLQRRGDGDRRQTASSRTATNRGNSR